MRTLTSLVFMMALCSACGGDDSDEQRACTVRDSCFETETGDIGAHIGLCNSLQGMLSDGCATGPRVGCCAHDGVNQCWYEMNGDAQALANVCASQHGTWTGG